MSGWAWAAVGIGVVAGALGAWAGIVMWVLDKWDWE